MQKWAVEQETQTESLITPTRPSDQSSQTDFDIAERKVEQGICAHRSDLSYDLTCQTPWQKLLEF
jgi:uncharacterized protein